jgi:hypothetical protein
MDPDVEVNFIRVELETGFTMLSLARTERKIPDPAGAEKAIVNARKALRSAKRFLPMLKNIDSGTMGELRRGINELEGAIHQYDDGR